MKPTGGGAPRVTDTLSKVPVASVEFCPLFTASPTYTAADMLMVRGAPTCCQFTPSADAAAVKVLPLRVSLTHEGSVWPVSDRSGRSLQPPSPRRKS